METSVTEQNKIIASRFLKLVSENNAAAMCDMITDNWIMLGGLPDLPRGSEGLKILLEHLTEVEQTWEINDLIAEGDKVVARATNTCTQPSFFGLDGHGKKQVFTATFIHRIENGKIAETWRNADDLGRVFQLGGKLIEYHSLH